MYPAGHTLYRLLLEKDNSGQMAEAIVKSAWKCAVGESIRSNAVPESLADKVLILAVPDLTWQRQLEKISSELLYKLNLTLGSSKVKRLRFRIDPQSVLNTRAATPSAKKDDHTLIDKVDVEIRNAAESIGNESLRRQFLLLAARSLNRS